MLCTDDEARGRTGHVEALNALMNALRNATGIHEVDVRCKVIAKGVTRAIVYAWQKHARPCHVSGESDAKTSEKPCLHLGEEMRIHVKSNRAGYLHIFNLGTSGAVCKLYPNSARATNRVEVGKEYALPGPELLPEDLIKGPWVEEGPVSSKHGLPERVLAIVTDANIALGPKALAQGLAGVSVRGGQESLEKAVADLFALPAGSWGYGLVELEVVR